MVRPAFILLGGRIFRSGDELTRAVRGPIDGLEFFEAVEGLQLIRQELMFQWPCLIRVHLEHDIARNASLHIMKEVFDLGRELVGERQGYLEPSCFA